MSRFVLIYVDEHRYELYRVKSPAVHDEE